MTVSTSTNKSGPYAGSGTTGPFTVTFPFLENSHLRVIRTSVAGVDSDLALTTDYTVTGAGTPSGTVTLVSALLTGQKLTIVRNVPLTQETDYVAGDAFPAESHERALDKLTMITQQLAEEVDRAVKVSASSTDDPEALVASVRASESAAAASAASAAASFDSFDDRYLGPKASDPTLDNDGQALLAGALYWNATGTVMRVYTGSLWQDVAQGVSTPFQTFSGTGAQTAFTLSGTPGSLGSVEVFISGVRQTPTTNYTLSGTTLTFVVAPPAGTNNVFVRWISTQAINVPALGSVGAAQIADGVITPAKFDTATAARLGAMKNRIINGKMEIAQRGTSFAAIANGAYSLDRWVWSNTSAAVVTASQQADVPSSNEFQSSLRVAVTTADTSIAAGDLALVSQRIEGYNVRDLIGKTFTLSFWVRSSKTGTHCVAVRNTGGTRSYVAEYTIIAANTWEYKTVTVSGGLITAGVWDWATGIGVVVDWALAAGTTFQTTAGAWQTGNFLATANQVNCLDTIGNIFAITGVQLEVGSVATPFEHRPFGAELALCQRYYWQISSVNIGVAALTNATGSDGLIRFPVPMRATPTCTVASFSVGSGNAGTPSINTTTAEQFSVRNSGAGWTVGTPVTANTVAASIEL